MLELLREAQAAGEVRAGDVAVLSRLLDDLTGTAAQQVRLANPQAFDGLGNESYPAAATAPGRTFGLSLVIRYTSTEYPS